MKARCENPKNKDFKHYGARGIKVLWKSQQEFVDDMYPSFLLHVEEFGSYNTTLERINGDGNYEKGNCKWATWSEQIANRDLDRNKVL